MMLPGGVTSVSTSCAATITLDPATANAMRPVSHIGRLETWSVGEWESGDSPTLELSHSPTAATTLEAVRVIVWVLTGERTNQTTGAADGAGRLCHLR